MTRRFFIERTKLQIKGSLELLKIIVLGICFCLDDDDIKKAWKLYFELFKKVE